MIGVSSDDEPSSLASNGQEDNLAEPSVEFVLLLCFAASAEGIDNMLIPSVLYALQVDVGLTLQELATLNMVTGLCISFAAPIWGVLADRDIVSRPTILAVGALGWGIATGLLAIADDWSTMLVIRAFHGVMLACLRPTCNSLVADAYCEKRRGKAFGLIQSSYDVGVMVVPLFATPLSTKRIFGVQGWRPLFLVICVFSLLVSLVLSRRLHEVPRGKVPKQPVGDENWMATIKTELFRVSRIFATPTFALIVLQGVFGFVPWVALSYATLFFQTAGLSSMCAGALTSCSTGAQAVGHFLGGYIGDFFFRRFGHHGRPFVAQLSAILCIVFVYLLFNGLPPGPDAFVWYLAMLLCLGLTGTWQLAGATLPMMSDVVPADSRSTIIAWDTAIEGASGNVFGGPVVALLATHVFGYDLNGKADHASIENAEALGHALSWMSCVPFFLCLCIASLTHCSYPADIQKMASPTKASEDTEA